MKIKILRKFNKQRNIKRIILASVLIPLLTITAIDSVTVCKIYSETKNITRNIDVLRSDINKKELSNVLTINKNIEQSLKNLDRYSDNFVLLDKLPIAKTNINLLTDLTVIGENLTESVNTVYPKIESNLVSLLNKEDDKTVYNALAVIDATVNTSDVFEKNISNITNFLEKYHDNKFVIRPIRVKVDEIYSKYYEKVAFVENNKELFKNVPSLLGYNKSKKYLLLFQNNGELRATGGFIGTYGIVDVKNGEIDNLFTDNIYNLDNSAYWLNEKAPEYFSKNFTVKKMYMRDANYNPDFEETAKYIIELYKKESRKNIEIEGVIAITPDVLEDIIGYFGNIKLQDNVFTKENVVDLLNYETKFAYWKEENIPASQRKVIIQKLANVILTKIKALSSEDLTKLINTTVVTNLDNKQILFYMNNESAQKFLADNNWTGNIVDVSTNTDYLAVVDSNLGSGKTDKFVDRKVDYNIKLTNDNTLKATLTLNYTYNFDEYINNGIYKDDPSFTNYYKIYTRAYVPAGSKLVGFKVDDEDLDVSNVTITKENNKEVFGYYSKIPVNKTGTYIFEYILPNTILASVYNGSYDLVIQKQAGIEYGNLNINTNFKKAVQSYSVESLNNSYDKALSSNTYSNTFNLNGKIYTDKKISIDLLSKNELKSLVKTIKKEYLSFNKSEAIK